MSNELKTDAELWSALQCLNDDLFDSEFTEAAVHEELKALGIDPKALSKRAVDFATKLKDEERLAWRRNAERRRDEFAALADVTQTSLSEEMSRPALLARLHELRDENSGVGNAVKMAARKRKPEESTDDELRALVKEMELLLAIENSDEG